MYPFLSLSNPKMYFLWRVDSKNFISLCGESYLLHNTVFGEKYDKNDTNLINLPDFVSIMSFFSFKISISTLGTLMKGTDAFLECYEQ